MPKHSKIQLLNKEKMIIVTHPQRMSCAVIFPCFEKLFSYLDHSTHPLSVISDLTSVKSVSIDFYKCFRSPVLPRIMNHQNYGKHAIVNAPSYIQFLVSMLGMFGRASTDTIFFSSVKEAKEYLRIS